MGHGAAHSMKKSRNPGGHADPNLPWLNERDAHLAEAIQFYRNFIQMSSNSYNFIAIYSIPPQCYIIFIEFQLILNSK